MQVLFFELVDHRGGADLQHPSGVTNAAGLHRPLDDLLFDRWRLTGIARVQQKGASFFLSALSATITWFALTGDAVSDDIRALALRTVQDLENHGSTGWLGGCSDGHTPRADSRSTPLKHSQRKDVTQPPPDQPLLYGRTWKI